MLSWEHPPMVVGGLGRHVGALAPALVAAGHEVTVVTRTGPEADGRAAAADEVTADGVRVVRVPEDPPLVPFQDLLAWTMAFNHALTRGALRLEGPFDVVHAHDWLVAHTAAAMKEHFGAPLVATIHATEAGRHQGWLPAPLNQAIHSVEWWLTYEARRVITCSTAMRWEVTTLFDLPAAGVDVVPNGIDCADWKPSAKAVATARAAMAADGPVVLFSGRLEYEKGIRTLLQAVPRLRRRHPGLRVVIAGTGTQEQQLKDLAKELRLGRSVTFLGHLAGDDIAAYVAAADVSVVPSLYEPFGLVALEAMAVATPVVAAATGGLREIVTDGVTGLTFPPEDAAGLADAVTRLLRDDLLARRCTSRARERVAADYSWSAVARRTGEVYERAVREERSLQAAISAGRVTGVKTPLHPVPREGNLLAGRA